MTIPYKFRICIAIGDGPVIELFRANRPYHHADWSYWTRDLSPAWDRWTEFPMNDKDCISPRPVARTLPKPSSETRSRLYAANPHQE